MEVIPDGVIDESFRCLCLTTCLVLEHNIIIPPITHIKTSQPPDYRYTFCGIFLLQYFYMFRQQGKFTATNLLLTLKLVGLLKLSKGLPRTSSASFAFSSSSCFCRSCIHRLSLKNREARFLKKIQNIYSENILCPNKSHIALLQGLHTVTTVIKSKMVVEQYKI